MMTQKIPLSRPIEVWVKSCLVESLGQIPCCTLQVHSLELVNQWLALSRILVLPSKSTFIRHCWVLENFVHEDRRNHVSEPHGGIDHLENMF